MNENVIKFYKDLGLMDDNMYKYLKECVHFISEDAKDCLPYVGCFTKEKDGVLKNIHVTLPCGDSLETTCVQVHEIGHFIDLYSYLDKPFEAYSGIEIFPIAMERIFFEKTGDPELIEWFNNYQKGLIDDILTSNQNEHLLGLLHHFDYVDQYRETGYLPKILDFSLYQNANPKSILNEKAKSLLKNF